MPTKKKLYTDTRFAICSQRRWNAQAKGAKEAEALVAKEVEQLDGSTSINTNTELEFWEDPNAPKFETPEEMMYRMRLAKKSKRTEKRRIARERKAAPMRNALMEKLTQKPVVIHGMVDEYGNYGGNVGHLVSEALLPSASNGKISAASMLTLGQFFSSTKDKEEDKKDIDQFTFFSYLNTA